MNTIPSLSNDDFKLVLSSPTEHFTDPELKSCLATLDGESPRIYGGGRVGIVGRLNKGNISFAVKVFSYLDSETFRDISNISKYLGYDWPQSLVSYRVQPKGIHFFGNFYPVVVMPFVEHSLTSALLTQSPLNCREISIFDYCSIKNNRSSNCREGIVFDIHQMANDLEKRKIRLGDIHHDNLRINSDHRLQCIDLDGLHVEVLPRRSAEGLSREGYRHRGQTSNSDVLFAFRFALWVVLANVITSIGDKAIWERYSDPSGDRLLFQQSDLDDPNRSTLFHALISSPSEAVRVIGRSLMLFSLRPLVDTPPLGVIPFGSFVKLRKHWFFKYFL